METSVEEEFSLSDFSPRSLTFIPGLNCVLASNKNGETRTIDVVTGKVQKCPGNYDINFCVCDSNNEGCGGVWGVFH